MVCGAVELYYSIKSKVFLLIILVIFTIIHCYKLGEQNNRTALHSVKMQTSSTCISNYIYIFQNNLIVQSAPL